MNRKYQNQKVFQIKPRPQRVIYAKKYNEDVLPLIFGLIMMAAGMNVLSATHDIRSGIFILVGALLIVGILFGTLQAVVIEDDELIFSYRLTKNVYKASDVKTIEWQRALYSQKPAMPINTSDRQRVREDLPGQYSSRYSFLSVEMKNGKKAKIPGSPDSRVDIQKILVAWQGKYTTPASENAAETN